MAKTLIPLKANGDLTIYLGIDIGGTMIKWGLIRSDGIVLESGLVATEPERGQQCFLQKLLKLITRVKGRGIAGIGISTAGIVDSSSGTVIDGIQNIPFLKGLNLKTFLEGETGLSVRVVNDVRAAALGEKWIGAGQDCDTFFCMTIGTGIGGCLMIDSKIFEGAHFRAGEIGYFNYEDETRFLEKHSSARGLLENAKEELGEVLSSSEFFERVQKNDTRTVGVFDHWVGQIAKAIATVIILFDPQKVIIGGGITEQGSLLLNVIRQRTAECLPDGFAVQCPIELATCKNDAGVVGAVRFLMDSKPTINT
ncbi:MAG: hypothetical protein K0Q85_121 [Caproiciproducens sp.]|nr:hypothetical protein [Caproiciproducens sp.]